MPRRAHPKLDGSRNEHQAVAKAGKAAAVIVHGDALAAVAGWPTPTAIVVDGPYGVSGYPGDPPTPDHLPAWYEPHVAALVGRLCALDDAVVLGHRVELGARPPGARRARLGVQDLSRLG